MRMVLRMLDELTTEKGSLREIPSWRVWLPSFTPMEISNALQILPSPWNALPELTSFISRVIRSNLKKRYRYNWTVESWESSSPSPSLSTFFTQKPVIRFYTSGDWICSVTMQGGFMDLTIKRRANLEPLGQSNGIYEASSPDTPGDARGQGFPLMGFSSGGFRS